MKQKSVVLPISLNLLGTIIGAGIFGLPAVFSYTGVLGGTLLFAFILLIVISLNLLYVDVIYSFHNKHRLPGYALKIIGRKSYLAALISMVAKTAGTSLAYIILGGVFLSMLSRGFGFQYPEWMWTVVFWGICSLVVYYGLKVVTEVESKLTWMLIGFIIFTIIVLFPFFNWQSASSVIPGGFMGAIGVIFFATTAMTVLPDILEIGGRNQAQARLGVIIAIIAAGVLSWLFGISIASVYPNITGIQDIQQAFPQIFWWLIPLIGLLAVSTSYITFTQSLQNMLYFDLKVDHIPAWIAAIVAPMLLFVLVSQNFLATIGFVGAVLTAFNGLIICACAYRILRVHRLETVSVLELVGIKLQPDGLFVKIWRLLPIPISIILLGIMIEHLISLL